ncbi:hypothetical protein EV359DRAFT_84949 [Lentinula novae-zelandiae]|nr:hypothetical protein EV359DRAFT_84949 [Lentinula novae-zelandiae]
MLNYVLLLRYYLQCLRTSAPTSTSRDLPPGLTLYWELSCLELTSATIYNDPVLSILSTTTRTTDLPGPPRNLFKGQPFQSELLTNSDPGLTLYQALPSPNGLVATSTERPSSSKLKSRKQKSTLSHGNTTQAQKSNQAASSTAITVVAGQRLMPIPEQSIGDESSSNVRTPEGCQPAAQEPPPVDPGMGPLQRRYTSMGYAQPASSPMGGFAYSPTWGTRGPPPGPVPQLDMESASNAGGRVSGQVAAIERIQGEKADPLTL